MSCDYNTFFETDFTLEGRKCQKCPKDAPFGYGFDDKVCESCADVALYQGKATTLVKFLFSTACPDDVNPPEPEEEIEPEVVPEPEVPDEEEEETNKPDIDLKPEPKDGEGKITDGTDKVTPQEETDLTILWVIIAITAVVLVIGGFAIWKFYTTCRNKSKIKITKVKEIGGGGKQSSSKSKLKENAGPKSGVVSKKKSKKKN